MEIFLGYIAGLLTLINPCVLPVLPIAIASSFSAHRQGPLALAAGMSVAFVTLGITVSTIGYSVGLDEETIAQGAAVMMIIFGSVLLVPQINEKFATATAGFSSKADMTMNELEDNGLRSQFLGGILLGAIWSPCIGPTLGGAISLASQGSNLVYAGSIMTAFAMGISTVILLLAYGARNVIKQRQESLRKLAAKAKPIMGITFILVGLMIFFKFHHVIETALLDIMPTWLLDLSVKF